MLFSGDSARRWGLWALAVCLSIAAYHLSVFGVFFLVPLVWIKRQYGEVPVCVASVLAAAGIVVVEVVLKGILGTEWTLLDTVFLGLPLVLIVGLVVLLWMERLGWRFLYRLLTVTAVVGFVLFPLMAFLLKQEAFYQIVEKAFDSFWKQISQTPGMDKTGLTGTQNQTEFFELLKQAFLGSFLLVFFLMWVFTERISRLFDAKRAFSTLKDFFIPPQGTWVLLGIWGLVLVQGLLNRLGMSWDWGFFQYVLLNAGWIALVIYAAAGWGILHSLMDQWRWPRIGQSVIRMVLLLLLLVPGAGQLLVMVGLPVLAVLELWVNFRKRTQGVGL